MEILRKKDYANCKIGVKRLNPYWVQGRIPALLLEKGGAA